MYKLSNLLTICFIEGDLVISNDFKGTTLSITPEIINFLCNYKDYDSKESIIGEITHIIDNRKKANELFQILLEEKIFIKKDSAHESIEYQILNDFPYGKPTTLHALTLNLNKYLSGEDEIKKMARLVSQGRFSSQQYEKNGNVIKLGLSSKADNIFNTFSERRSARKFSNKAISKEELGSMLYSGLAITDFLNLPHRPSFPLRFTPSPGGLASVTGFVFSNNVSQLKKTIYKYDGFNQGLIDVGSTIPIDINRLFGNQTWPEESAAIVVLVAEHPKIQEKYRDAGTYNALLLEAGHIAQNISITSTVFGLSTVFTNALEQKNLCDLFKVSWPAILPIYAIAIGDTSDIIEPAEDYTPEQVQLLKKFIDENNL